ncbi:serine/threonine-protein kinase PknK [bacterium]|nr:serine/threonine-protein kinase PknK [bacterium]
MIEMKGFQFTETAYISEKSVIYRGIREKDNLPVIAKVMKEEYPTPKKLESYDREYNIVRRLEIPGVIKHYSLEKIGHRKALIMEDIGAVSLSKHLATHSIGLELFLEIAISLAGILGEIHQRNIIHKDIKPSNILLNSKTKEIRLIDFSLSTQIQHEFQDDANPEDLEGTLAYIAPEQTGRMNRTIDSRSDLYSLGITFYQMLAGKLPFEYTDSMELVHAHIAIKAVSLKTISPKTPQAISDIVDRLLQKDPENRYQSAFGLKADLEECLDRLKATGEIQLFPLARKDFDGKFNIPRKLYGREKEIEWLLKSFEEVRKGKRKLTMVSGLPGIGKSALVNEIQSHVAEWRGYFTSGRFEKTRQNTPYSALIQAFQGLIKRILSESDERIEVWKENLVKALGINGKIITDIIPDVALIIGPQPDITPVGPAESRNRFDFVFTDFVSVFAKKDHPLVIFMDNLQWADLASLVLVEKLSSKHTIRFLHAIGAFTSSEVTESHPLMIGLNNLKKSGLEFDHISLSFLNNDQVGDLIAEILKIEKTKSHPLAEIIVQKTNGNPFFVNRFLKKLHDDKLLEFDRTKGWKWDKDKISQIRISDNVINFMTEEIACLPENTLDILKLSACIGENIKLELLSQLLAQPAEEIMISLSKAMQGRFITFWKDTIQFQHGKIREAFLTLISRKNRQEFHLKIGRFFLRNLDSNNRQETIFKLVDHLDEAIGLIKDEAELDRLIELNLEAGRKARFSAAYPSALKYYETAIGLLKSDSWKTHYQLSHTLYTEAAEAAYLAGNISQLEELAEVVFLRSKTLNDKLSTYINKIVTYMTLLEEEKALNMSLQVLQRLGIRFPKKPGKRHIYLAFLKIKLIFAFRSGERYKDLIKLPDAQDTTLLPTIHFLATVLFLAYSTSPRHFLLMESKLIELLFRCWNSEIAALVFSTYGITLAGIMNDIPNSIHVSELALLLHEKSGDKKNEALIFQTVATSRHFYQHLNKILPFLLQGYKSGINSGSLASAAFCLTRYSYYSYWTSTDLNELGNDMSEHWYAIQQVNQLWSLRHLEIWLQTVLNLQGKNLDPCRLVGTGHDEDEGLMEFEKTNDKTGLAFLYASKTHLCYLFENIPQALENAQIVEKNYEILVGGLAQIKFNFHNSLIQLATYSQAPMKEKRELLKKVKANQKLLKRWATHAPMNFMHTYCLVEAEQAGILDQNDKARDYYEQAIKLARENQYLQEEALSNELAAKYYLSRGYTKVAATYMKEAHYLYNIWGAFAKTEDLARRYPQLISFSEPQRDKKKTISLATGSRKETGSGSFSTGLNFDTVLKATQAISGEIVMDKLITKLLLIMAENTGAQKGIFLTVKDNDIFVDAQIYFEKKDIKI